MAQTKLGVINLYERVAALAAAEAVPAAFAFGWRVPAQHPYGNRFAWVPGDQNGGLGVVGPPRNPGRTPRSIATLNETFTVVINGQDLSDPENEEAQYAIVRYLYDWLLRAVYRYAYGAHSVVYDEWVTNKLERRHGAAIRVVFELQAVIPDVPWSGDLPYVVMPPPPLAIDLLVSLLDVTDSMHVSNGVLEPVTYLGDPVTYLGEPVTVLVDA